jgi:hypothetical protein
MKALGRTQRLVWLYRHQPLTVRLLAASAGILSAAAAFAAPANANPIDDNFVGALSRAGINVGDAGNATSLGQTACSMLAKPGGNFAGAVERVRGGGISPSMASMFTTIAIQMYCPTMLTQISSGQMPSLPGIGGIPGMGGIPGI